MAIEMTVLDAIEKGHTNADEIFEYIKTDIFEKAVKRYIKLIQENF